MKKLLKELEMVMWDNVVELLVYFEVVDVMLEEWLNMIIIM